ncbi:hypothetical protein [Carp edema virus]|nr:hypothetical protein [Carp edema virus]
MEINNNFIVTTFAIIIFCILILYLGTSWLETQFDIQKNNKIKPADDFINNNDFIKYKPIVYKEIDLKNFSEELNLLKESNYLLEKMVSDLKTNLNAIVMSNSNLKVTLNEEHKAHDLIISTFVSEL